MIAPKFNILSYKVVEERFNENLKTYSSVLEITTDYEDELKYGDLISMNDVSFIVLKKNDDGSFHILSPSQEEPHIFDFNKGMLRGNIEEMKK